MKRKLLVCSLFLGSLFSACQTGETPDKQEEPKEGMWRGSIQLNDSVHSPFNFELSHQEGKYKVVIFNASEEIEVTDIEEKGDSLKIRMPVFANYLLVQKGAEELTGEYVNPDAEDYRLPFRATYGDSARFKTYADNCCDINTKWRVVLGAGTDDEDPAIAYFSQNATHVEGTFVAEWGDFRYLQGVLSGDTLKLSAFDGGSLYYFEARIVDGQQMKGIRYSGRSFSEPWTAFRDEDFELSDPDTLTHIKEGYEHLSFSFPDLDGDTLSLEDERFENKPVIITIMGSWCPNCMDEARYLKDLHQQYHSKGLEIVGLTFERVRDRETAIARARKMKEDIGMPYPVLLAGATRDDRAEKALPMLNHVMSYPTTIYLNRNHEVVRIHTGFTGPGTPMYDEFVARNHSFIENQLLEQAESPKS